MYLKGSEPEWANQKQITSQVSYLQMLDISCGRYTLEMLCTYSARGFHVPGYTPCKGYITDVRHILWQVYLRNVKGYLLKVFKSMQGAQHLLNYVDI